LVVVKQEVVASKAGMSSSSEIRGKLRSSIAKLVDKKLEVPTKDSYELWANFWVLPNSIEDLQAVFQPADIRFIRDHSAEGFSGLILSVSTHLIYLSKIQNEKLKDFPTSEFLNCVRLLTILFPFIYEKKQKCYPYFITNCVSYREKKVKNVILPPPPHKFYSGLLGQYVALY